MSKSNAFEQAWQQHVFLNAALAGIGDASGLQPAAVAGNLYAAFHATDPGEGGGQTTGEIAYNGYARQPIPRTAPYWDVTSGIATLLQDIPFPVGGAGASGTAPYFSIGTSVSGAGMILYSGPVNIAAVFGEARQPVLKAGTTCSED